MRIDWGGWSQVRLTPSPNSIVLIIYCNYMYKYALPGSMSIKTEQSMCTMQYNTGRPLRLRCTIARHNPGSITAAIQQQIAFEMLARRGTAWSHRSDDRSCCCCQHRRKCFYRCCCCCCRYCGVAAPPPPAPPPLLLLMMMLLMLPLPLLLLLPLPLLLLLPSAPAAADALSTADATYCSHCC